MQPSAAVQLSYRVSISNTARGIPERHVVAQAVEIEVVAVSSDQHGVGVALKVEKPWILLTAILHVYCQRFYDVGLVEKQRAMTYALDRTGHQTTETSHWLRPSTCLRQRQLCNTYRYSSPSCC